ncbi:NhaA family Na+:H+ antiporter [Filimonas zeae]|uniref:Na(+)/H(+) antiporter NhaA n=1 Tax=Filimonas zeae TaxID=1737353 RepID=A0A917IWF7_9BACT|nr:Na+/H+ antiporter NhaA [Filimonas zeae]MDR6339426.1 NhaA family Na+:H+ antiporter [Filimonas zeae]GGH63645.1 Na(+)/H(+) antiporter NhaA [Filimonas zeae]
MQKNSGPGIVKKLITSASFSGILIFACVVLSLLVANSPLSASLQTWLTTELGYQSDNIHLRYTIQSWINDGLMAVFFLLVGLEIKKEIVAGELSTTKKALLPVLCALGGAVTPAFIYAIFNSGRATAGGWGIPMATDIAFALAIMGMLSKRVPASLKVFLAALAIADDLMAILVIALFYAGEIHIQYLGYAAAMALVLFILNRLKAHNLFCYLIPGMLLWYFVHHSGIHATIAGVLTALFVPVAAKNKTSPLQRLEHFLAQPVNLLIVPLFAFCNTNITFDSGMPGALLTPLGLGIVVGLLVGKPLGILLVSWLGIKTGISHLPQQATWRHMLGTGLLAGIGFTMSIFMALLSFEDAHVIAQAKFAVLCGSVISATVGYFILKTTRQP